ncbi:hypothetical protein AB1L42_06955 [Thalassoglobus sp. JC818]|uniref:hypothetical protein n=1 Tax=Thalassoglobus sp. JC818 TaxID=3232136 RepID=UPI00345839A4
MTVSDNPFETPSPRGIRLVQATLRVTLALQCWGYAAQRIHHHSDYVLTNLLAQAKNWDVDRIQQVNDVTAYVLIVSGLLILVRPIWLVLLPLAGWQTGMAVAAVVTGTGAVSALEPAIQAVRYILPTALLLVDFWPPKVKPGLAVCLSSIGLLRFAIAATFIGQGLLALYEFQRGGNLVDLISLTAQNFFGRELASEQAQNLLAIVGAVDVAIAVALLSSRNRLVALFAVLWGLATAFSHTVAFGIDGYPATLVRAADVGAVLTVLIFWIVAVEEQAARILPEVEDEDLP